MHPCLNLSSMRVLQREHLNAHPDTVTRHSSTAGHTARISASACGSWRVFTSHMEEWLWETPVFWHVIRWRCWQVWWSGCVCVRETSEVLSVNFEQCLKQRPLLYAYGGLRVAAISHQRCGGFSSELSAHPYPLKDNLALEWGAASNPFHSVGCNMPPLKTPFIVRKEQELWYQQLSAIWAITLTDQDPVQLLDKTDDTQSTIIYHIYKLLS